ncbi:MAG: GIY-YIG nuclease family protein [Methylococcaceae bacterium]
MKLFDILNTLDATITPEKSKIHLAIYNGKENPLDIYLEGNFEEWQRCQNRKNFEREYVISLIALPNQNNWLFAGIHNSDSPPQHINNNQKNHYRYDLSENTNFSELNGKLILSFTRQGRQSHLNAETWHEKILLSEIKQKKLSIGEFSGYKNVNITKSQLDLIVNQSLESWRTALANVAGVYLISDSKSGKLYVGNATGDDGIWQRWSSYSKTGHGGNVKLKELLNNEGIMRASYFNYSILEIADTHTIKNDILLRESHWKDILLSRLYGLNEN